MFFFFFFPGNQTSMEDDGATPPMPARMIIAEGGDVEAGKERWKAILQWREENHVVECFFLF